MVARSASASSGAAYGSASTCDSSGGTKPEVRQFLQMLETMGVLVDREDESDSFFDTTIRPVGDWLRTVFGADHKL